MATKKETKVETPAAETAKENKETVNAITESLMKTNREGMGDLIRYMWQIGFFEAPCSGGNHLCETGGLAEHSLNVYKVAEKLSVALYGAANITPEIRASVTISSLLHDLGKCGDYDKAMYIPAVLKSGKVSEKKPFKRNPELSAVPHAIRSIKIATLFIDLTEDEEWAILCHDGLYDFMKYDMQGHETPLSMIIHDADMWASKVIEKESEDETDV